MDLPCECYNEEGRTVPGSLSPTQASVNPGPEESKHWSPLSLYTVSSPSGCIVSGQSNKEDSVPLQPGLLRATSGYTRSLGMNGRTLNRADNSRGPTDPDPKPSCRQATSASSGPKSMAQIWLQEPSKKTSGRPTCQLATAIWSTSLRSPSSAHGRYFF